MGQKYTPPPRVIIWDEVCILSQPILEVFFEWLDIRGRPSDLLR